MSDETIYNKGASGYVSVQASSAVAAGGVSSGARTTPLVAFTADEANYIAIDFQLKLTAGIPVVLSEIKVYRRASDGTNQSPAPTPAYLHEPVGAFSLDNVTGTYYIYGVTAGDPNDEYYIFNDDPAATLTMELLARASSFNAVP